GGPRGYRDPRLTGWTEKRERELGEQSAASLGQTAPRGKTPLRRRQQRPPLPTRRSTRSSTPGRGAGAARASYGPGSRPIPVPACHLDETVRPPNADAPAAVGPGGPAGPAPRRSTISGRPLAPARGVPRAASPPAPS